MSNFNKTKTIKSKQTKPIQSDRIDALWVMSYASVVKDPSTKDIIGYNCYCDECKKRSSSGNGGIAFTTAEELLEHRNMKAFLCPAHCGIHVCEQRTSILSHITQFHSEILAKLEKEGLDKYKSWIYHDDVSYTLTKPIPNFEDKSSLESVGEILSMAFTIPKPKKVYVPPSPIMCESPVPTNKFIPINTSRKPWGDVKNKVTSFQNVILEQQNIIVEKDNKTSEPIEPIESNKPSIHYAQEDMYKEKQCPYGTKCTKKDRPFACALNHDGAGDIIKLGTILSEDVLCQFERPPFTRCFNTRCTKVHLKGREDFIKTKKAAYNKEEVKEIKEDKPDAIKTSVLSVNDNGIDIVLSIKNAQAISDALNELELNNSTENEWTVVNHKKHRNNLGNDNINA